MQLSPSMGFLAQYSRWINWRLEPDPFRPDKPKKIPVNPRTGYNCDPTDLSSHCSHAEAAAAAATRGHGVGFVFMQGDNLWFLDLDGCKQADGQWTPLAVSLVQAFGGHAACEVSQSKRGLHLFGWAKDIPPHGCKNVTMGMELYHHARFVAFTDDGPTGCIDADTSAQLAGVINTFFPKTSATSDFVDWRDIGVDESPTGATPDDDELLSIMLRSGQNTASAYFNPNHVPFAALWAANDEVLGKKWPDVTGSKGRAYDASYADSALASHLAFWCAKDCRRIEMFMRMSRLARDKWDDREDYLPNTIINACATVRNVAKPRELQEPLSGGQSAAVVPPPPVTGNPVSGLGSYADTGGLTATTVATVDGLPPQPAPASLVTGGTGLLPRKGVNIMSASEQERFFAGCVYVVDTNKVWVMRSGTMQDKARFDITHGGASFITNSSGEGKPEKSAWEAYTKNQCYAPRVALKACFRPEQPSGIITAEGLLNTYVPFPTPQVDGDASKWEDHLRRLFPVDDDRAIITAWMAATVRNPGAKHQWWPVVQGMEGNGKTLLNTVMVFSVGERYSHFVRTAALAKSGMQFNAWITGNLYLSFEEVNVGDKRDFLDEIKDLVTNRRVAREGKGIDQDSADNRANGMMFSNWRGAVPIARGGRRYSIFYCPQQEEGDLERWGMTNEYFSDLHDWLYGRNVYAELGADYGLRVINHWLMHKAVIDARFDPCGQCQRAPRTSSTDAALVESLGTVEQEVVEQVEAGALGFTGGWINGYYLDNLLATMRVKIPRTKRRKMLHDLGYIPHPGLPDGRCVMPLDGIGVRPRLYVRMGHLTCNMQAPKMIQDAYEQAQKVKVVTGVAA